jgi:hypothetical protein
VLLALPVLWRHGKPARLGLVAGVIAVSLHVTAARLWTLRPLHATIWLDALGVLSLWSLPVVAYCVGRLVVWRRTRQAVRRTDHQSALWS